MLDIPFEGRRWKDIVTLDTLHAYCGGPKPMLAARRLKDYSCRRKFTF